MQSYSLRAVSELIGLSTDQIRGYVKSGVLAPQRGARREFLFSFQDVVLLRTAKGLLDACVPARRARRALRKLKDDLAAVRSLSAVRIQADGEYVVVREDDRVWNAESGQGHFDFEVGELIGKIEALAEPGQLFADLDPNMTSDEWYNLGLDLEDFSPLDALHAYLQAVALDAGNADAHVNLGRIQQMQGNLDAAAEHYLNATQADPGHQLAFYNYGTICDEQERIGEAMSAYRKAPDVADAHYNLARLYEIRGDQLAALRHFRRFQAMERERR